MRRVIRSTVMIYFCGNSSEYEFIQFVNGFASVLLNVALSYEEGSGLKADDLLLKALIRGITVFFSNGILGFFSTFIFYSLL